MPSNNNIRFFRQAFSTRVPPPKIDERIEYNTTNFDPRLQDRIRRTTRAVAKRKRATITLSCIIHLIHCPLLTPEETAAQEREEREHQQQLMMLKRQNNNTTNKSNKNGITASSATAKNEQADPSSSSNSLIMNDPKIKEMVAQFEEKKKKQEAEKRKIKKLLVEYSKALKKYERSLTTRQRQLHPENDYGDDNHVSAINKSDTPGVKRKAVHFENEEADNDEDRRNPLNTMMTTQNQLTGRSNGNTCNQQQQQQHQQKIHNMVAFLRNDVESGNYMQVLSFDDNHDSEEFVLGHVSSGGGFPETEENNDDEEEEDDPFGLSQIRDEKVLLRTTRKKSLDRGVVLDSGSLSSPTAANLKRTATGSSFPPPPRTKQNTLATTTTMSPKNTSSSSSFSKLLRQHVSAIRNQNGKNNNNNNSITRLFSKVELERLVREHLQEEENLREEKRSRKRLRNQRRRRRSSSHNSSSTSSSSSSSSSSSHSSSSSSFSDSSGATIDMIEDNNEVFNAANNKNNNNNNNTIKKRNKKEAIDDDDDEETHILKEAGIAGSPVAATRFIKSTSGEPKLTMFCTVPLTATPDDAIRLIDKDLRQFHKRKLKHYPEFYALHPTFEAFGALDRTRRPLSGGPSSGTLPLIEGLGTFPYPPLAVIPNAIAVTRMALETSLESQKRTVQYRNWLLESQYLMLMSKMMREIANVAQLTYRSEAIEREYMLKRMGKEGTAIHMRKVQEEESTHRSMLEQESLFGVEQLVEFRKSVQSFYEDAVFEFKRSSSYLEATKVIMSRSREEIVQIVKSRERWVDLQEARDAFWKQYDYKLRCCYTEARLNHEIVAVKESAEQNGYYHNVGATVHATQELKLERRRRSSCYFAVTTTKTENTKKKDDDDDDDDDDADGDDNIALKRKPFGKWLTSSSVVSPKSSSSLSALVNQNFVTGDAFCSTQVGFNYRTSPNKNHHNNSNSSSSHHLKK